MIDPPAEVRTALDEAFLVVKGLVRRTRTEALALGKALIAAKKICPPKQWITRLEATGMKRRLAQVLMKKAEEAKNEDCEEKRTLCAFDLLDEGDKTGEPAKAADETPKKCKSCRCLVTPPADCKECYVLNHREPGDDTEAEQKAVEKAHPDVKRLNRHTEGLSKIAENGAKRDVKPEDVRGLPEEIKHLHERLWKLATAPVRGQEPRAAKCTKCGRPILWVITTNGKPMSVDEAPTEFGTFDLRNGLAHYIKYEPGRNWPLYRPHMQTCPQRNK
jgi:hypothetical protein